MTLAARRRPSLAFLALLAVLCGLQAPCFALNLIYDVTKERAKELGISVVSRPSANNDARVQVEFKTVGPMKGFEYAHLELTQGGKRLVTAPLMPRKPTQDSPPESVQLDFYIDPAALPNTTVTVYVYGERLTGIGYRLKMKDFLARSASR